MNAKFDMNITDNVATVTVTISGPPNDVADVVNTLATALQEYKDANEG